MEENANDFIKKKEEILDRIDKIQDEMDVCRKNTNLMALFSVISVGVWCIGSVVGQTAVCALGIMALIFCIIMIKKYKKIEVEKVILLDRAGREIDELMKVKYEMDDTVIHTGKLNLKPSYGVCPQCGSNQIKNISTAKRVTSTYMLGLASSDIGKTFECKNCKYKW